MSQGRENAGSPPGPSPDPGAREPGQEGGFGALEQALGGPRGSGRHATRPDGAAARASSRPPPSPPPTDASESLGRPQAAYSAGPRTIPSTRPPRELDQDVPAVIVAQEERPSGRQQTTRMNAPLLQRPQTPTVTIPRSSVPVPVASPAPAFGYPSSPPPPAYGSPASLMGTEPRPRQPTLVMRKRGPSAAARFFAFVVVLALVLAVGLLGIVLRKPEWLGLSRAPKEAPAVRIVPVLVPAEPTAAATTTAAPTATASTPAATAPATPSPSPSPAPKPKKPAAARPAQGAQSAPPGPTAPVQVAPF